MTPEDIAKWKRDDRIDPIHPLDPLLVGRAFYKGEVIDQRNYGVLIRTNDPEHGSEGELYSWDDPRLVDAHNFGPATPGEPPWLSPTPRKRPKASKKPGRRSRPRSTRRSSHRGGRR
jgi:hypothetical protein